jgi:hypothetical protein
LSFKCCHNQTDPDTGDEIITVEVAGAVACKKDNSADWPANGDDWKTFSPPAFTPNFVLNTVVKTVGKSNATLDHAHFQYNCRTKTWDVHTTGLGIYENAILKCVLGEFSITPGCTASR